ncbi:protein ANTAGONIST OF LIKE HETEROCHROMATIN PROTEIN 1-like isoform X2 [Nasonia vitripennis]|uniref:Nuclease harbi1 n=1 Tax=Nasonia vitripennis TaxID=7425 RepID=A0A7M7IVU1_NASVI|nr:protein ANTAGONIST OF LIKE HETEROCHROMATIN PROTEIN 1-like isoform X2 [Nasonia vitripennis]
MDNQRLAILITVDEIISSSSNSDSDLDINDNIFNNNNHRCIHRIPRIRNFIENVIARYDDQQFQEHFRLLRSTFNYVLYLIRADLESEWGNITVDAEKQLYVALYILGTLDSYRSVTTKFDIGKATAWRAVKRINSSSKEYFYII